MLETTVKVLQQSERAVAELISKELSPALSFKISRMAREFEREMELFRPLWMKALQTHGTPIRDRAGAFDVSPENLPAFDAEVDPVLDSAVALNCDTVRISEFFAGMPPVALKPALLAALHWFIVEDPPHPAP
jgi:hypothetical protein